MDETMHFQRPLYRTAPMTQIDTDITPFRIRSESEVSMQRIVLDDEKIVRPHTLDTTRTIHFFYIESGNGRTWLSEDGYIDWEKGDTLFLSSEVDMIYHEGNRAVLLYITCGEGSLTFSPLVYKYNVVKAKANQLFSHVEHKELLLTNSWMMNHFSTTPSMSLFFVDIASRLEQPCRQAKFEIIVLGRQDFVYTILAPTREGVDRMDCIEWWTTQLRIPLGWWYRHVNDSNRSVQCMMLEVR
ncbi:MAG: hypothetical protein CMM15_10940 [Rhodospirillaceae bacterium]|nr:hypothetical protein [Rhodospirillaceae bacterium]OUX67869.1 MAG: hypothetical protein CBD38_01195 [bacterium TMED178]